MSTRARTTKAVFTDKSARAKKKLLAIIVTNVKEFAQLTQRLAKNRVAYKTGNLRSNIKIEVDPKGMGFRIFTRTKYGAWVELGTVHMAARPFIFPSVQESKERFEGALVSDGKKLRW